MGYTFREAAEQLVRSLEAGEHNGAKRPRMRGYAYAVAGDGGEEGGDGGSKPLIVLCSPDGTERSFTVAVLDGGALETVAASDGWTMTAEQIDALVFADDWRVAPVEELEKSRKGESEM